MRGVLEQYKTGYRTMNPDTILEIYPSFSKERQQALRDTQKDCREYTVEFAQQNISVNADGTAYVTAKATYS